MSSTYTDLGIELMVTGANDGTWGTKTNTNLEIINQMQGYVNKSIAGGEQTTALLIADGSTSSSDARNLIIELSGTITGNQIVTVPDSIEKSYIVYNNTSGAFTVEFKTASGTGSTFSTTDKGVKILWSDGTNVVDATTLLTTLGNITTGTITSGEITATGNIVPGANDTYDLGASGNVWQNVYTGDLHLNNEHKTEGNIVDGSKGSWTLQEGAEDIYLINNKSNEKFRLKLEKNLKEILMGIISNGNTVIDNGAIDANEVDTTQIANDAVTADKLANTAVSAGSYTSASITVDAQGRITSASSGSGGAGGFVPKTLSLGPSSGTYSSTTGTSAILAYAVGGGGGGGSGNDGRGKYGGDGGAGAFGAYTKDVTHPFSQPFSVGGGGAAGPAGSSTTGSSGGATSLATVFNVNGGSGGTGGNFVPGNVGATGNVSNSPTPASVSATNPDVYPVFTSLGRGGAGGINSVGSGKAGGITIYENIGTG